jgi:Poxvirus Late Transcription Factor VLTF3 like
MPPAAKIRNLSIPNHVNRGTVESKHKEKMEQFEKNKNLTSFIEKDIQNLQSKLNDPSLEPIPKKELQEQINLKLTEINNIKNHKAEYKYLLDAGPLLFKYYNHLDNPSKQKSINRFDLYDEYNSLTDPYYVKHSKPQDNLTESICPNCNVLLNLNYRESIYICPICAIECTTFIDSDRPSYKDPPPEVNYFAYKRINHFNELLAQFQAKESTHIPPEVFEIIRMELKKERKTVKDLNFELIRRYLKKHSHKKYNQYYDHIFHIINRLNGEKPKNMTPEMEEKLRYLFLQIQEPFEKYCPPDRKNFISYNFVFYKFCELLGYKEFLGYFPLLKSKDKLYEQEKIWEKICHDIKLY